MMKTKFNLWGVMAAAAIMLSAGVGFTYAASVDDATHYNATPSDAEDQTPRWQPITPGGQGSQACISSSRPCKAVQTGSSFTVLEYGNLQ